jgi:hypothetical protein
MKDKKAKEDKVIKQRRKGLLTVKEANKKLTQIKDSSSTR